LRPCSMIPIIGFRFRMRRRLGWLVPGRSRPAWATRELDVAHPEPASITDPGIGQGIGQGVTDATYPPGARS
jgi:hypothetical protein